MAAKPIVITLEEHWVDPLIGNEGQSQNRPLLDLGPIRLAAMNEAGIDVQVLSHTIWREVNAETEVELAIRANNRMKQACDEQPTRFKAFATLPMRDARAGAEELSRSIEQLGFCGAMIFPIYDGEFLDEEHFWPVFERAEKLDVPIYIHPGRVHPTIVDIYYSKFLKEFPTFASSVWGFGFEAGTCAMRLIFARLFERYPNLKIILGHLAEFIPFGLDRIEERIDHRRKEHFPFRETFCEHFYCTTSGFFSTPALICTIMQLGIDRVMFSIDWPMNDAPPGMDWMAKLPFSPEEKAKIYGGNAQRLLRI